MASKVTSLVYYVLFEYDTPKIVQIKSKTVGLINRFIQLVIISYIIGWVIVYNHGYQELSPLHSSVTTKVKGAVYTNDSQLLKHQVLTPSFYNRIWDVADYIIPPQEHGAFFIMTNAIITPNQTIGTCPTEPENGTVCHPNVSISNCVEGKTAAGGNGVMTGNCVKYDDKDYTCEVHAWVPLEIDALLQPYDKRPLLQGTEDFTVLVKNSIRFKLWPKYKTRNIIQSTNNLSYLKSCTHDENNPFCPIFKLGKIVESAGENYTTMATFGGVMGIMINWDCNLDFNIRDCVPKYSFKRLDDPVEIAAGWNFRFAHYQNDYTRTLYKAYGILFVVMIEGQGRQFNVMPLFLNIGSGLALLSIAEVVCDIIVLYFMRKRDYYREQKYLVVNDNSETAVHEDATRSGSTRSRSSYQTFGEESS